MTLSAGRDKVISAWNCFLSPVIWKHFNIPVKPVLSSISSHKITLYFQYLLSAGWGEMWWYIQLKDCKRCKSKCFDFVHYLGMAIPDSLWAIACCPHCPLAGYGICVPQLEPETWCFVPHSEVTGHICHVSRIGTSGPYPKILLVFFSWVHLK